MADNVKQNIVWRAYSALLIFLILSLGVVYKIVHIQTVERSHWLSRAEKQALQYTTIEPRRGNIYAANGSLLSTSIPEYELRLDLAAEGLQDTTFNNGVDSLAWCLSDYFGNHTQAEWAKTLRAARKKKSRYLLIARKVSYLNLKEIREFPIFRHGLYRGGFIVQEKSRRIMPLDRLAYRTIGYAAPGLKPVGLEGAYNTYLTGEAGMRLMQRISHGRSIPVHDKAEKDPQDGLDIITTIDVSIQDATYAALLAATQRHAPHHACAIVMEVKTGKIVAISNLTKMPDGTYDEIYNYAIGESSEPGSTFKLASVMALLEEGSAKPGTLVSTAGGQTQFFDRVMKDSKEGGYGNISLEKAFALSSNVGISKLVYQAFSKRPEVFINYLKSLQIDKPMGVSIMGEGKPYLKTPNSPNWNGTTLPWMSIGYEVSQTPLQTLALYNAIANGGSMMRPYFVTAIKEGAATIQSIEPDVINPEVCGSQTLKQVQRMLEMVVDSGTAMSLKSPLYQIAGKTGTAQVADDSRGYHGKKTYKSSFCGYFPADKPEYSCIVVITDPSENGFYGAAVAAPVFRQISDRIYASKAANPADTVSGLEYFADAAEVMQGKHYSAFMHTVSNRKTSSAAKEWIAPKGGQYKPVNLRTNHKPDVKGMVLTDAVYLLEMAGYTVRFSGHGRVAEAIEDDQNPKLIHIKLQQG